MTTIKSFSDLQQSKKLAEILPLESADGFWRYHDKWYSEGDEWEGYEDYPRAEPYLEYTRKENEWKEDKSDVSCWSLASLLGVLPEYHLSSPNPLCSMYCCRVEDIETYANNPIDACYEMIIRLHELKML